MALEVAVAAIKIFIVVNVVQLVVAYMIYVERKVIAHAQLRLGPMRVGWHGLLQPIADGLKLFFKEDIIPDKADRVVFVLAPVMVLVPALVVYAVLPFSATFYITQINIGLFFVLAISSLACSRGDGGLGLDSKYSLWARSGARRNAELRDIPGFSVKRAADARPSLNLQEIVHAQARMVRVLSAVGLYVFFIRALRRRTGCPSTCPRRKPNSWPASHEYRG